MIVHPEDPGTHLQLEAAFSMNHSELMPLVLWQDTLNSLPSQLRPLCAVTRILKSEQSK